MNLLNEKQHKNGTNLHWQSLSMRSASALTHRSFEFFGKFFSDARRLDRSYKLSTARIGAKAWSWNTLTQGCVVLYGIVRNFNGGILPMIFPRISKIAVCTGSLALAALFAASATLAQSRIALTFTEFLIRQTPAFQIELHNIEFKPGHPTTNETLLQAISANAHVAEQILQEAVVTLRTNPTFHITVEGFTDTQECPKTVGDALSLRRATLVYDWLLQHGVSSSQLKGPIGYGSASPIDDNSDAGRQRNRRVELELGL